jgi:hypothetical protein
MRPLKCRKSPLLREYVVKSRIEGSNPSASSRYIPRHPIGGFFSNKNPREISHLESILPRRVAQDRTGKG